MVRQLNNPSHVGAQSCAHALPCECIETAVSPYHISFLFVYFTGALPPYPYELFEKSSTKNFRLASPQRHNIGGKNHTKEVLS